MIWIPHYAAEQGSTIAVAGITVNKLRYSSCRYQQVPSVQRQTDPVSARSLCQIPTLSLRTCKKKKNPSMSNVFKYEPTRWMLLSHPHRLTVWTLSAWRCAQTLQHNCSRKTHPAKRIAALIQKLDRVRGCVKSENPPARSGWKKRSAHTNQRVSTST